jgi:hypothetical protein
MSTATGSTRHRHSTLLVVVVTVLATTFGAQTKLTAPPADRNLVTGR